MNMKPISYKKGGRLTPPFFIIAPEVLNRQEQQMDFLY